MDHTIESHVWFKMVVVVIFCRYLSIINVEIFLKIMKHVSFVMVNLGREICLVETAI